MVVGGFDIAADGVLQFAGGAMNTPPDLLFGQGGEPALDQVQPRGAGRREVHMEPRMTSQPAMNQGRFVSAIVVQNQVNIQNGRHRRLDAVQELAELYRAMPGVEISRSEEHTSELQSLAYLVC